MFSKGGTMRFKTAFLFAAIMSLAACDQGTSNSPGGGPAMVTGDGICPAAGSLSTEDFRGGGPDHRPVPARPPGSRQASCTGGFYLSFSGLQGTMNIAEQASGAVSGCVGYGGGYYPVDGNCEGDRVTLMVHYGSGILLDGNVYDNGQVSMQGANWSATESR